MSVVSSSVFLSAPPDTENQDIPGLTCVSQSNVQWDSSCQDLLLSQCLQRTSFTWQLEKQIYKEQKDNMFEKQVPGASGKLYQPALGRKTRRLFFRNLWSFMDQVFLFLSRFPPGCWRQWIWHKINRETEGQFPPYTCRIRDSYQDRGARFRWEGISGWGCSCKKYYIVLGLCELPVS